MAQVDIDDSGSSGFSLPAHFGGNNFRRCVADLYGKQRAGRDFQMTVTVLPAPFEYLVCIPHVLAERKTGNEGVLTESKKIFLLLLLSFSAANL